MNKILHQFLPTVFILILISGTSCSDPGHIVNGQRRGNAPFECTSFVTYSCNSGFQLKGSPFLTCSSNGRWDAEKPTCVLPGNRWMSAISLFSLSETLYLKSRIQISRGPSEFFFDRGGVAIYVTDNILQRYFLLF